MEFGILSFSLHLRFCRIIWCTRLEVRKERKLWVDISGILLWRNRAMQQNWGGVEVTLGADEEMIWQGEETELGSWGKAPRLERWSCWCGSHSPKTQHLSIWAKSRNRAQDLHFWQACSIISDRPSLHIEDQSILISEDWVRENPNKHVLLSSAHLSPVYCH